MLTFDKHKEGYSNTESSDKKSWRILIFFWFWTECHQCHFLIFNWLVEKADASEFFKSSDRKSKFLQMKSLANSKILTQLCVISIRNLQEFRPVKQMAAVDISLVCRNTENQTQLFKTLARFCDFDPEPSKIPNSEANGSS